MKISKACEGRWTLPVLSFEFRSLHTHPQVFDAPVLGTWYGFPFIRKEEKLKEDLVTLHRALGYLICGAEGRRWEDILHFSSRADAPTAQELGVVGIDGAVVTDPDHPGSLNSDLSDRLWDERRHPWVRAFDAIGLPQSIAWVV